MAQGGAGGSWFVDNSINTGSNNGTSWANAWRSFAVINWSSVQPGDTIYVSGGPTSQTYTETWSVGKSGISGSPISISVGQDPGHNGTVIFDYNSDGDNSSRTAITVNRNYITFTGNAGGQNHMQLNNLRNVIDRLSAIGISGDSTTGITIDHMTFINDNNPIHITSLAGLSIHDSSFQQVRGDAAIEAGGGSLTWDSNRIFNNYIETMVNGAVPPGGSGSYNGPDAIQSGDGYSIYNNKFKVITTTVYTSNQHSDSIQAAGGNNVKVYNNEFINVGDSNIDLSVWWANAVINNFWVYNNIFRIETQIDPYPDYIRVYANPGNIASISNVKILNNTFVDNNTMNATSCGNSLSDTCAVHFGPYGGNPTGSGNEIRNNIFYNSGFASRPVLGIGTSSGFTATSFAFSNNVYYSTGPIYYQGTTYSASSWIASGKDPNSTTAQPKFTAYVSNGTNNNFHLLSNDTAAKDTGIDMSAYFASDTDGIVRPQGLSWDIGAYEYTTFASDTIPPTISIILVDAPVATNQAPVVNAGTNQTVSLVSGASLSGTATDDGLPTGSTLIRSWSTVSGPGTVTFGNAAASATTASFSAAGTYVLQLSANDSLLSSSSTVTITVTAANGRTFYVDFASGSDANNGTSKSTPWKHAPGMQGTSGVAASTTPKPGDQIIFKGGVTWDHTAFKWNLIWSGTSGQPIYLGVDTSWFAGSSWTRPIFNGDHTALANGDSIINVNSQNYITLDNIEIKGHRAFSVWGPGSIAHSCSTYFVMQNLFVHDWDLPPTFTTDDAHGGIIGLSSSCPQTGTKITHSIISNAEARDIGRQNGVAVRATDVEYSIIHDAPTSQLFGLVHDSEFYNIGYPSLGRGVVGSNLSIDPTFHENVTYVEHWEGVGMPYSRPGMVYNNFFHDFAAGSGAIYLNACPAVPFFVFNNVVYNQFTTNGAVNIDQYGGSGTCGEYHIWNNTFQVSPIIDNEPVRQVGRGIVMKILDMENNHFIQDSGSGVSIESGVSTYINSNNVSQTNGSANGQGYTPANKYSPSTGSIGTIGVGKNLSANGIPQLNSDIRQKDRPAIWDAGAYQH